MGGSAYNPRVISAGFDTVEGVFSGGVLPDVVSILDLLKGQSQRTEIAQSFPTLDLAVQSHGLRPFAWILVGPDYHLRLGRVRDAAGGFRMLSVGLASRGCDDLLGRIKADMARLMVEPMGHLCRVDTYCDIQGWDPTFDQMRGMVCASGFRPVYPSVDDPQTFQFGKGDFVVRIYNKTEEQRVKPSHWPGVWAASPVYDRDQTVWRVEVQMRRAALTRYCLGDFGSLRCPRPFFFCGLEWASLRVRSAQDSNASRWALHPVWRDLLDRYSWSDPVPYVRADASFARVDQLMPQIVGLLASCGASLGIEDLPDLVVALAPFADKYEAESGITFADRVISRQMGIYGRRYAGEIPS
jgi:hypothetical protein